MCRGSEGSMGNEFFERSIDTITRRIFYLENFQLIKLQNLSVYQLVNPDTSLFNTTNRTALFNDFVVLCICT